MSASDPVLIRANVDAAGVRHALTTSTLGLFALVAGVGYTWYRFASLVEPVLLTAWVTYMALVATALAGSMFLFARLKPGSEAVQRVWLPLGSGFAVAISTGAIASVWILLPQAPPDLRELLIRLYFGFLVVSMLSNSLIRFAVRLTVIGLLGSVIAFMLLYETPDAVPQAIGLVIFAAILITMRDQIRHAAVVETEARVQSEAAADQTLRALETVAAERDAKTRFIAAASHDLQQPLQAAALYFEAAVTAPAGLARARAIVGARAAFASTQQLIEAMLDHLRLEAGAVPVRPESVPVGATLAGIADRHAGAARVNGMRISALQNQLVTLADAHLLDRALGNLVVNAIRHSGGTRLLLAARPRGLQVEIWVIDDGRGIDANDAERLFEDYAQGSTAACKAGGFGLGLASVRRQVDLMGGSVAHDARWTTGAAFVLRLPLAVPSGRPGIIASARAMADTAN